jgi:hypothetical protein
MSLHSTYFGSSGLAQLLRTQGESIELLPKNGDPAQMTALVSSEESSIERDDRGRKVLRKPKFTITKDPASAFGGADDPQVNASVIWSEVEYAVKVRQDCGTHWELLCEFIGRSERSRAGLRAHD